MLSPAGKWLAAGLTVGLACGLSCLGGAPLQRLELWASDLLLCLRPSFSPPQDIVIVAIDDRSISHLGRWPWPRSYHAALVRRLHRAGARVIAFDVLFTEPSPHDGELAQAAAEAGCVVLAAQVTRDPPAAVSGAPPTKGPITPLIVVHQDRLATAPYVALPVAPLTTSAAAIGAATLRPDPDGAVRRALMLVAERTSGVLYPSFPLAVVACAQRSDLSRTRFDLTRRALLPSGVPIPLDESGSAVVSFGSYASRFTQYSFMDVLSGAAPGQAFRNKIVLVGFTAGGLLDVYPTVLSAGTPGVEINAHIVSDLLHGTFIRTADRRTAIGMTALLGLLAATLSARLRPIPAAALVLLFAIIFVVGTLRLLIEAHHLLPVAGPLLAMTATYVGVSACRLATEEAARRRLRDEFRRYAPPQVVARLDAGVLERRLAGTLRPVSVLFADIRDFSGLTARTNPATTVALLNNYFEAMTAVAFDLEGTVDNIVGDEILVTFNVMEDQPDHAERAVHLAVNMVEELERLNGAWIEGGVLSSPLRIGIGINTGEAVVGNVGSRIRTQYTVIGQTVNLASRLEKLNKLLGTTILTTAEVVQALGERFETRAMGRREIAGHPELVDVYEIVGRRVASSETQSTRVTVSGAEQGQVLKDGHGSL